MNNYYEILEVSQNASKEVIEKAYKVLAKKYHPDLQEQNEKQKAEQKMKLINEAYETLSNDEKKEQYDIKLQDEIQRKKQIEFEKIRQDNLIKQNENNNYNIEEEILTQKQIKEQIKQQKRERKQFQEEQERIYRNYMRSLGYRIKEKWTLKRFIKLLEAIAIFLIAILIIWFFPPTHKLIVQTYEENEIIKIIVDVILNIMQGLGNGISIFLKTILGKK